MPKASKKTNAKRAREDKKGLAAEHAAKKREVGEEMEVDECVQDEASVPPLPPPPPPLPPVGTAAVTQTSPPPSPKKTILIPSVVEMSREAEPVTCPQEARVEAVSKKQADLEDVIRRLEGLVATSRSDITTLKQLSREKEQADLKATVSSQQNMIHVQNTLLRYQWEAQQQYSCLLIRLSTMDKGIESLNESIKQAKTTPTPPASPPTKPKPWTPTPAARPNAPQPFNPRPGTPPQSKHTPAAQSARPSPSCYPTTSQFLPAAVMNTGGGGVFPY